MHLNSNFEPLEMTIFMMRKYRLNDTIPNPIQRPNHVCGVTNAHNQENLCDRPLKENKELHFGLL